MSFRIRTLTPVCSVMTLPSLTHYEMRCSGNGLKQSVLSGQIHQQVNFHNPRRAVIGRERTNSDGGAQVAVPVTQQGGHSAAHQAAALEDDTWYPEFEVANIRAASIPECYDSVCVAVGLVVLFDGESPCKAEVG